MPLPSSRCKVPLHRLMFCISSNSLLCNHRAPVPVPEVLKRGVTEQEVQAVAQRGTVLINRVLGFLKRVLHLTDPIATGQTAAALYTVARIAGLVSPVTLAFVLVLLAFTLPKIYELRKPQIDDAVATLKVQVSGRQGRGMGSHVRAMVSRAV